MSKLGKSSAVLLMCLVFFWGNVAYADSPTDSNGIHKCASYTYNYSLKTFNCQADGPRTLANITFGNTVGLVTNEIAGSYLYIENDHSSNTYGYHFTIGYDNDYVSLDDIYYRSDSDTTASINVNHSYQSDGTIDTTVVFGNPQLGTGWLDPDERIRVYLDWQYKGSASDWYYWAPEFDFLGTKYHFLAGIVTGSSDIYSGLFPEVGTTDDIQLLGNNVSTSRALQSTETLREEDKEDPFEEWRKIQILKKQGLWKADNYSVTIKNSKGEVVLITDAANYKNNKEKIEEEFNLVPVTK